MIAPIARRAGLALGAVILAALTVTTAEAASVSVRCVQEQLATLGFAVGSADGAFGGKTRAGGVGYLAANADATLPELTADSAAAWCRGLAARHSALASSAERAAAELMVFGKDVSEEEIAATAEAFTILDDYFATALKANVAREFRFAMSGDAATLGAEHMKMLGVSGDGWRQSLTQKWGDSCGGGEAGYGWMVVCTKSDSYNRDATGGGLRFQRIKLIAHEYFHVLQADLVGPKGKDCCSPETISARGPAWLIEGSAEYVANVVMAHLGIYDIQEQMDWQVASGRANARPLAASDTYNGFNADGAAIGAAMAAVHRLVRRAGMPSIAEYYRGMGEGLTWQAAFEKGFGIAPDAYYAEFDRFLIEGKDDLAPPAAPVASATEAEAMACVQNQLKDLGYAVSNLDGTLSQDTAEAAEAYVAAMQAKDPNWGMAGLSPASARLWCEKVALAWPEVNLYWKFLDMKPSSPATNP